MDGQATAFVRLPRSVLAGSRAAAPLESPSPGRDVLERNDEWQPPVDLVGSLRLAIRGYLADRYPDVQLAARLADTSVRTLQRQLAEVGLSYASLVRRVRIEVAIELLGNPDVTMLEAAGLVGYEDPSNFSRAFRQATGRSPREFRQHRKTTPPTGKEKPENFGEPFPVLADTSAMDRVPNVRGRTSVFSNMSKK